MPLQIPFDLAGNPLSDWRGKPGLMEAYHVAAIDFQLAQVRTESWKQKTLCLKPIYGWHARHRRPDKSVPCGCNRTFSWHRCIPLLCNLAVLL